MYVLGSQPSCSPPLIVRCRKGGALMRTGVLPSSSSHVKYSLTRTDNWLCVCYVRSGGVGGSVPSPAANDVIMLRTNATAAHIREPFTNKVKTEEWKIQLGSAYKESPAKTR